jgi:uncharacterized protein (DUF427 family)
MVELSPQRSSGGRGTVATSLRDPRREGLTFQASSRWVRGTRRDATVVDSKHPLLVWEPGRPIVSYAFPRSELADGVLVPTQAPPDAPPGRGNHYHLAVGDDLIEHAAWSWPDPELADYVAVAWRALEHWYEEDEEVFGHARDPYHRVDALASSRHVQLAVAGRMLADTRRPVLVYETTLPVRYYIPLQDVRGEQLLPSDTRTRCPYKGHASYYRLLGESGSYEDLAWAYPEPAPGLERLRGTVAFYNEHVDITVDDELQPRPHTPWSTPTTVPGARAA